MLPNCTVMKKKNPSLRTILGDGQEKPWDLDCARSDREEHRAAEVVPRSGSTEPWDLVATWGIGFLGNSNVVGKGKNHPETSKGIAPQPTGFKCFSVRELGLSAAIYFSKSFGLKSVLVCLAAPVTAMDGEDVSQGVFGQFFGILYAMMVILVWEVFRWLMSHLTLLVVPQFNRQMVEQAELMVKLALKDREKDVRGGEGHSTAAPTVEKDEHQEEEPRPGEDHRKEKRRKTEERDADRAHDKRERGRDRRRRGETGRSRSPHREKESTTRRSESEKSPGPSTAESRGSERVPKGPIAPLPEGMKAPGRPPPKKPSMPTPKEEEKVPTDDEEWGKWKEQREGEKMADYLARMRSVYGKAIPAEPREKPAETTRASSSKAAPKAAAYYEVDGGEWYWWDGAWGDKWEPKKKKKKKNKYTEAEWEQWYKEHPEEDTESSQTPRRPAEPETPPPAQRPRIRPGQDLIRRPEDPASWDSLHA